MKDITTFIYEVTSDKKADKLYDQVEKIFEPWNTHGKNNRYDVYKEVTVQEIVDALAKEGFKEKKFKNGKLVFNKDSYDLNVYSADRYLDPSKNGYKTKFEIRDWSVWKEEK